ncbi:hypothetical protein BH09PLA1_BH09PLA1_02890 [soil metagenome]
MSKLSESKVKARPARSHPPLEQLETRVLLAGSPAAKLYAGPMDVWGPTYTFKVVYTSSKRLRPSSVDHNDILVTGPGGYSRLARFVSMVDNLRTITARYKVSTPRNIWDPSSNGTYKFTMVAGQVKDLDERFVPAGVLGSFVAKVPSFPTTVGQQGYNPRNGAVNVRDFGAIPDDGIDDTDAIQAAINSLPRGNGVPTGADPMGGIVFLPKGIYKISRPLMIQSAIVLRGEGDQTVLYGVSNNPNDSVVRVYSPFEHGFMIRAGVQNLKIYSDVSKGIDVSSEIDDGDIVGLKISNVTISTGGAGIDTRGKDIYQSTVENVTFTDMGSTALAMTWTRPLGNAAINYIHNVVINGIGRAGFVAEDGLVILNGDFNVDGLDIGDIGKKVTPLVAYRAVVMRNLVLRAGSKNLPGGVLAKFDNGNFQLDWIDNVGPGRTLQFTRTTTSTIGTLRLANGATVQTALSIDNVSHLAVERFQAAVPTLTGVDVRRFSTKAMTLPDASRRANVVVNSMLAGPASKLVVDASVFGVIGNDGIDDTDALQAAIDSLPRGDGVPGLNGDVGGTVFLPLGRIDLSRPILLPSGVWLVGQGNGTALYNSSPNQNDAAIVLVSGAAAGFNNGAGITNLGLYTQNTAGIRGDASVVNGVFDLTIDSLTLSAGGTGIDLRYVKTFAANINSIGAPGAGSAVIWIGDEYGYSADNRINDVQVYAENDRPNYRPDKALFVFRGQNTIENLWIENEYEQILPMYVSGRANIYGLWLEPGVEFLPEPVSVVFENASNVTIDKLFSIDLNRQMRLINSNVSVGNLNIAGYVDSLSDCVQLSSTSTLNLGWVNAIYDVGMADDPRVSIGGVFNQNAGLYVDHTKVMTGTNLLQTIGQWSIQWGDGYGEVDGQASIENTPNGPRLKIEVFSNPNDRPISVFITANVPASAIGKPAAASWRLDANGEALVWTREYHSQFQARNTGSATVAPLPGVLTGNDQIVVTLSKTSGIAYLSNFRLVAL